MPEGFTLTPILIPLAALIIGWAIGFFDSNSRTAKKIKEAEARVEHAQKDAERKIAQAEQQFAVNVATPQDDRGLLRIKNENGRAMVEMDGTLVSGALSADKKKRLIELLTIIRPYLEGGQPQPAALKPAAPATPIETPAQTPPELFPYGAPAPRPISRPAPPPEPVKPVAATLGTILSPAKKSVEEKPLASLSIIGQIDTVLQSRLVNTPLAGQGIRLQESVEGAVEVYIGLQKFAGIEDVPDQTIKAAIRAAVKEWEEKFTPGL